MSVFVTLPLPRCEARCGSVTIGHGFGTSEERAAEEWQCSKDARYRHEESGHVVCGQHKAAIEWRNKPVLFISANTKVRIGE